MNQEQQQLLALAAVFEAAVQADRIATGADLDPGAMEALFGGVMTMDADEATTIYPRRSASRTAFVCCAKA